MSFVAFDSRGALEAVDRILNRGGEPDAVLRDVLEAVRRRGVTFARIRFFAGGELVDAVVVGQAAAADETTIEFRGAPIGTLEVAADDPVFAERLATLVSAVSAESAKHFPRL